MENSTHPVFIDTTLDTHFLVEISNSDTVLELKEKIQTGHQECFKSKIDVTAVKVERNKKLYCLSDSVTVKSIFGGVSGFWSLLVDAVFSVVMVQPSEQDLRRKFPEDSLGTKVKNVVKQKKKKKIPTDKNPKQNATSKNVPDEGKAGGVATEVVDGSTKEENKPEGSDDKSMESLKTTQSGSNDPLKDLNTLTDKNPSQKRKLPEDSLGTEVKNVVKQKKKKKKIPTDENPKQNATSGNYSSKNVPDESKAGGVATEVVDGSTKEENKPDGSDDCVLGDKSMESLKTTQSGSNDPLKDLNTLTDKNPGQKSQKKTLVKKVKKVRTRKEKSDNNSSKNVPDEGIATEGGSRNEELKSSAVEDDQINFHDYFLPKGHGCVDMPNLASAHQVL